MNGLHCEIKDKTGNCYSSCIAMLTAIPWEELKTSWGIGEEGGSADFTRVTRQEIRDYESRLHATLHAHGFHMVSVGKHIPAGYSIATGNSPRGRWQHTWITLDGQPHFDPHPSEEFTPDVIEYEIIIPILGVIEGAE